MNKNLSPTDNQIVDACLSFRHDFGLMTNEDQKRLRQTALDWFYAWQKTLNENYKLLLQNPPPPPPTPPIRLVSDKVNPSKNKSATNCPKVVQFLNMVRKDGEFFDLVELDNGKILKRSLGEEEWEEVDSQGRFW